MRHRKLTAAQQKELRKLLMRRRELSDKNLCARFGISRAALWRYRAPRETQQNASIDELMAEVSTSGPFLVDSVAAALSQPLHAEPKIGGSSR